MGIFVSQPRREKHGGLLAIDFFKRVEALVSNASVIIDHGRTRQAGYAVRGDMFSQLPGGQPAGSGQAASGKDPGQDLDLCVLLEPQGFLPGLVAVFNHGDDFLILFLQARRGERSADHSLFL